MMTSVLVLLGFTWMFLALLLPPLLSPRLNPRLDPYFARYLDWLSMAPVFFRRFARAGLYATWVVKKEVFARNQPRVLAFDFRAGLDRTTYVLCVVHTVNVAAGFLVGFPVGLYLMLTR